MAEHHDTYNPIHVDVTVSGHARRQPAYTYSFNDAPESRSPLTGRDPNFLDGLLPFYDPASARGSPDPTDLDNFYTTYRQSPSPPAPSFLDTILNPAALDHNRFSPFNYHPPQPFTRQPFTTRDEMPPNTRARTQGSPRPSRLPNGYVDLTSSPDSPPQTRKRQSPTPGPSAKRQKRADGPAKSEGSKPLKVEEVDLTDEKEPVHEVLQKQRGDAIKAQTKPEETATTFNNFNCVICMDMPTDLTATACGHLFCHTCLMEALIAGENRSGPGEPKRSQCPVCRKLINRTKATDIIPLLLKKGLATQPRKKITSTSSTVAPKRTPRRAQPAKKRSNRYRIRDSSSVEWM